MGEERCKSVKEEVDKLLKENFIREVNDKWRMCTDYTNMNRAYPKDAYPLPSINRLVDGTSEF